MTLANKIQLGLLLTAGALVGWVWQQHTKQARDLAGVRLQLQTQQQELASRRLALEALAKRNTELEAAERRAGNGTLLALLRERNGVRLAASEAATQAAESSPGIGRALAKALASPEQRQAHDDSRRARMRADLYQFFKVLDLSPEKREAYIDLSLDKERRMADRLAALLQGKLPVAEAQQQRDSHDAAADQRAREVLGDKGKAFLDGIAEGLRKDEAKRLLGLVQDNMGETRLTQEQGDRLQALLKSEIIPIKMDDVELFRSPEEWAQYCQGCQQKVLSGVADLLTPAQLEALKTIGAYDLAERQKQMAARRAALGIK